VTETCARSMQRSTLRRRGILDQEQDILKGRGLIPKGTNPTLWLRRVHGSEPADRPFHFSAVFRVSPPPRTLA
jgi:hypothetical protein